MISASIPEKITYVCKQSVKIAPKFGEVEEEFYKTSAMPAFPVDPSNSNTIETARSWAQGYRHDDEADFNKEVEMSNDDIHEVQIVDLEIRAQGGRAYKAIVHGSFLVDIREDVMLEAMLIRGVRQGSFINCKFMWARIGSQMKLIRVGSSLHKAVIEADIRKKQKKVKSSELIVGNVYQNAHSKFLFIGFVKTAEIKLITNHSGGWYTRQTSTTIDRITKPAKYQLWYQLNYEFKDNNDITLENIMEKIQSQDNSSYYFDLTKSKSGLSKVNVNTFNLPDNIINISREEFVKNSASRDNSEYYNFNFLNMRPYSKEKFKLIDQFNELESYMV